MKYFNPIDFDRISAQKSAIKALFNFRISNSREQKMFKKNSDGWI